MVIMIVAMVRMMLAVVTMVLMMLVVVALVVLVLMGVILLLTLLYWRVFIRGLIEVLMAFVLEFGVMPFRFVIAAADATDGHFSLRFQIACSKV